MDDRESKMKILTLPTKLILPTIVNLTFCSITSCLLHNHTFYTTTKRFYRLSETNARPWISPFLEIEMNISLSQHFSLVFKLASSIYEQE